ncbi:MAG: hypothetical protein PHF51_05555 [Candidatus ainarchaeum sp.]|nr:hypothetical protein [Candidatus ainarchaeum sp.]
MAASALVSLVESALILGALLKPVLSYSPANLLFSLLRLAISAHAGASSGPKFSSSFAAGALASFSGALALCLAALASSVFGWGPVLGVNTPDQASFVILLALILVENSVLGGAVGATGGYAARRGRQGAQRKK